MTLIRLVSGGAKFGEAELHIVISGWPSVVVMRTSLELPEIMVLV